MNVESWPPDCAVRCKRPYRSDHVRVKRQEMCVERNNEARSCNHCRSGKAVSITYSECLFIALAIQHAMRMRHIVICDLPRYTVFLHIHKRHDFRKNKCYWTSNLCFDFLYGFCLKHSSFYEELSEIWSNIWTGLHAKYPLLSYFNENWIFSTDFRKIFKHQISLKSVQWEPSCSMRTDRQTRHDEASSLFFSKFCDSA